jgi:quaternary ammonium compound-resistance protein SugE
MKSIPTAIAFTIWTAISIVFIKTADIIFFESKINTTEIFFLCIIAIGIIGLKISAKV